MSLKSHIPNLLTLSNLICGILAIYFLHLAEAQVAASLILLAALFDFFDGLAARALRVSGELGKQLDSLADMVSFGVAPVFIALHLIGTLREIPATPEALLIGFAPLLMGAMAAYRLAVFNMDTRQSNSFIGVPTPAIALFWLSLVLIDGGSGSDAGSALENFYTAYLASPVLLAVSSVLCAVLMVLPLPLIALKFQGLSFSENAMRYVLIGMAVLLLLIFAVKAIPIILLLYIGISMVDHLRNSPHGLQSRN